LRTISSKLSWKIYSLKALARGEIARLGKEALEVQNLGGAQMGTGYGLRAYWASGQMIWKKLFRSDGVHGRRIRAQR
jgi:hypothetical protein